MSMLNQTKHKHISNPPENSHLAGIYSALYSFGRHSRSKV